MNTPMNGREKQALKESIPELTHQQQSGILDIVRDACDNNGAKDDVFEFELDQLPVHKCRELQKYVERCIKENIKKDKRKQADFKRREEKKKRQQEETPQPPTQSHMQVEPEQTYSLDAYPDNVLSEMLHADTNLQISQKRRREIEEYRRSFMSGMQMPVQ